MYKDFIRILHEITVFFGNGLCGRLVLHEQKRNNFKYESLLIFRFFLHSIGIQVETCTLCPKVGSFISYAFKFLPAFEHCLIFLHLLPFNLNHTVPIEKRLWPRKACLHADLAIRF